MFKYVPLDSILNFVSNAVKENVDNLQLLSWANQCYRKIELPFRYDTKVLMEASVENNKIVLPDDVKRIRWVGYTDVPVPEDLTLVIQQYTDETVVLQQELLFSHPYFSGFKPLRYIGQNKSPLIDNSLICNNCSSGFSIDAKMKCLTIDIPNTTLVIVYDAILKDDDCNILIPDSSDLQEGLAAYSSAMYFKDRADRGMEGAKSRYQEYLSISQNLITKFKNSIHLRNVNPFLQEVFLKSRYAVPGGYWNRKRNTRLFR